MKNTRGIGCISAFGIGRTIDDAFDLRPTDCTGTHRTGFHRDVQGSIGQVFASYGLRRSGDSLHLGMRRYVLERLREVMSPTDDLILGDDNASDRYLVGS